ARIREEDALEAGRRALDEPLAEPDRRLVGQSAEHHVGHPVELPLDGRHDVGMAVAVDHGPPGGHPVDELAPVLEPEPNARSALDREERTRDRRRIRMPDASLIALDEIRHALPPRPTLRPIGTGRGTANRRAFRRALRILPRPRSREKTRAPLP